MRELAELDQCGLTAQLPPRALQRLTSAPPRKVMADDAEREVIGDDVRTRNDHENAGGDQHDSVEEQPPQMMCSRAVEDPVADRRCLLRRPIRGVEGVGGPPAGAPPRGSPPGGW